MSTISVLVVDDDDVDVMAVKRSFRTRKLTNPVVVAHDGIEALAILRGNGNVPLAKPYVILLDLNMPRMSGAEFLSELRADPALRSAVVFVLTTSSNDEDRAAAYQHNVAGYILKSKTGNDLSAVTTLLSAYWNTVEFP